MAYFAEIDSSNLVLRVIVADTAEWAVENLGGTWVETRKRDPVEFYAAPGMYYVPHAPQKFVYPWRQPDDPESAYYTGTLVWHAGRAWVSDSDENVGEPGVAGWTEITQEPDQG